MNNFSSKIKLKSPQDFGQLSFNFGTFFLASALPISGIFYLFAIIISFFKTKYIFKNIWNISIVFISGLLIANTFLFNIQDLKDNLSDFDKSLTWISLFNWIPLFLVFIYFQIYLKTSYQRKLFSKYLIAGNIPVLVSCILQHFFKIYGPLETMDGLIIFFNKPPVDEGVTGLFSNQNYTGFWLSVSLPLLISLFNKFKKNNWKNYTLIILLFSTSYYIILSTSKNALIGSMTSLLLIFGLKKILSLIAIVLIFYFIVEFLQFIIPNFKLDLINHLRLNYVMTIFSEANIKNFFDFTRIKIWSKTIKLIIQKPLFGYGAATFPIIFFAISNLKMQHAHNLPLQIAYEYGLPIAIILSLFIVCLFSKTWLFIFKLKDENQNYFLDKCWLASCLAVILSQLNDITYYDGKISLLIWILFTGLKSISDNLSFKVKMNNQKVIN